jgi:Fic family protein
MLSFTVSPKMEKELKRLQGMLAEQCADLKSLSPNEAEYLHRFALISTIGASTRIENAVLTDQEIEWVDTELKKDERTTTFEAKKDFIFNKLSKDKERSIEEVAGCREVLTTVYLQSKELTPLRESTIRGLHHDLLRYYPNASDHAGGYKTTSNRVVSIQHETGESQIVLEPAAPGIETETAMADLVHWYNQAYRDYPWPLLLATEFVFRFLAIHPFKDGNGRLGRALFLMCLLQSDDPYLPKMVPYLSIDRHIEQNRTLYYNVLRQCSEGKFQQDPSQYKMEHFAWFNLKVFEEAFSDIAIYRKKYAAYKDLSESHLTILQCFKSSPEKRLQVNEIEKETQLNRRTIQRALKLLTDSGFLQVRGKGASIRYQLVF